MSTNKLSHKLSIFYALIFIVFCGLGGWNLGSGNFELGSILFSATVIICLVKDSLDLIGEKIDKVQR